MFPAGVLFLLALSYYRCRPAALPHLLYPEDHLMVDIESRLPGFKQNLSMVPEHIREGIALYVEHGRIPGDFLCAVISNDLFQALGRADHINRHALHEISAFIYTYTPSACFGSEKKMTAWSEHNGLQGKTNEASTDG